jgi:hypothetical protein
VTLFTHLVPGLSGLFFLFIKLSLLKLLKVRHLVVDGFDLRATALAF